jgi:hypothetical protein
MYEWIKCIKVNEQIGSKHTIIIINFNLVKSQYDKVGVEIKLSRKQNLMERKANEMKE